MSPCVHCVRSSGNAWLADRCLSSPGVHLAGHWNDPHERAGALQCCSDGAKTATCSHDDCVAGTSNAMAVTFFEAVALCNARNMRLCAREELAPGTRAAAGCCGGSCGSSHNLVWTSAVLERMGCAEYGCVGYNPKNSCQCDAECASNGNCCHDYAECSEAGKGGDAGGGGGKSGGTPPPASKQDARCTKAQAVLTALAVRCPVNPVTNLHDPTFCGRQAAPQCVAFLGSATDADIIELHASLLVCNSTTGYNRIDASVGVNPLLRLGTADAVRWMFRNVATDCGAGDARCGRAPSILCTRRSPSAFRAHVQSRMHVVCDQTRPLPPLLSGSPGLRARHRRRSASTSTPSCVGEMSGTRGKQESVRSASVLWWTTPSTGTHRRPIRGART